MDVETVVLSSIVSVLLTILIMVIFYSRWILPYLTKLTNSLPEKVKIMTEPYIDAKLNDVKDYLNTSVTELKGSFMQTSKRLNRTMNQAEDFLTGMDIDPSDDDAVDKARSVLTKRYGSDVAIEAITRLFTSIANQKEAAEAQKKAAAASNEEW